MLHSNIFNDIRTMTILWPSKETNGSTKISYGEWDFGKGPRKSACSEAREHRFNRYSNFRIYYRSHSRTDRSSRLHTG